MISLLSQVILAGLGVTIIAGPLGCFLVWRRMSYFGATLAHAALLGVALALYLQIDYRLGILFLSIVLSALLMVLKQNPMFELDNLLGIMAHSTLALGLVVLSLMPDVQVNMMGFLFGDILSVNATDVVWILGASLVALAIISLLWRKLLLVTLHEELAQVEGYNVKRIEFTYLLLLSIVIAVAMQVVGLLLVVSLLLIPPAIIRPFAVSPLAMALGSSLLGSLALLSGILFSWYLDTPTGPTIVVAAFLFFIISYCLHWYKAGRAR